eukprot:snap_masked-scaffold_16-processed-gene-5.23-mRNA-1 protein AED:0.35 eAED:0.36 QI:0/-1/0/1/-1/1/1/0/352
MYTNSAVESKYFPKFEEGIGSQEGKIVVITGTTSGTGFVAACTSLKKGATVLMLNRPSERIEESIKTICELVPGSKERIVSIECDLQDFESVRRAGEEVIAQCPEGIDILCNNAGIMAFKNEATKDGYDVQMQTNVLSAVLLTKMLLPSLVRRLHSYEAKYELEKTAQNKHNLKAVRIVNHSSLARLTPYVKLEAKYFGQDMTVLGNDGNGMKEGRYMRYHMTKLANSVFTLALHHKLQRRKINIKSVCAHPGTAVTGLAAATEGENALGSTVQKVMDDGQSPEDGAMGILKCMYADIASATMHGPYGIAGKAKKQPFGPGLHGKGSQKMLWEECSKAIGGFEIKRKIEYLV